METPEKKKWERPVITVLVKIDRNVSILKACKGSGTYFTYAGAGADNWGCNNLPPCAGPCSEKAQT